ncbi:MAG TPA: TorF family putative porin [Burkholderiales bacterium]|nr:TorF family putative porin [Burkholderiales bacterium]
MLKKTAIAGLLAAAATSGLTAAAEPTPEHTLTGNVGLFSQYIFRGLTQTNKEPALQGGFDYAHSSGLYAGTWASNISWLRDGGAYRAGGSLEWDFYGGWKPTFGDFAFDLGTLYYWYPGDAAFSAPGAPGNPKADTWELYAGAGWKWLTAKFSYSMRNKTFAVLDSKGTWYLDLTATVPLGDFAKELTGVTLMAHWGKQKYSGTDPRTAALGSNDALYSYEDWKVGISYALPQNFTIGAFYTDTSGANPLGYGSVSEGGVFPRNIAKGTGTIYIQKTF